METASTTGLLPPPAYNFLALLARLVCGDTQEIEGMNNVAKNIVRLAPKSALSLVSCRTAVRKLLGLGSKGASRKWSNVTDRYNQLREAAVEGDDTHNEIIGNRDRFAASEPVPFLSQPSSRPPEKTTARTCMLRWYWKEGKYHTANRCVFFKSGPACMLASAWLQAWSYSLETYFLKCSIVNRPGANVTIKVIKPFVRAI